MKYISCTFVILLWCFHQCVIRALPQKHSHNNAKKAAAIRKARDMCVTYMGYRFRNTTHESPVPGLPDIEKSTLDCRKQEPLIVNGENAETKEFPHMALIGYGPNLKEAEWRCGGSLISDQYVLSAAHCGHLSSGVKATWAKLGDLDYGDEEDEGKPVNLRIIGIITHPNYKPPDTYNDIALFRLHSRVTFNAYVRPICLFTEGMSLPRDNTALITGWGQTGTTEVESTHLLKTTINFIDNKKCEESYKRNSKKFSKGFQPKISICAGDLSNGNDTCEGDSGGPLQIPMPNESCAFLQVGITSVGKLDCGDKSNPAIYTRVSSYIRWIVETVWPR